MHRSGSRSLTRAIFGISIVFASAVAGAQTIDFGRPAMKHGEVELLSDSVSVKAGVPDAVDLRFRVKPGLHINSHTPGDELLLPTIATFSNTSKVAVLDEAYPKSEVIRLKVGEGAAMNVYSGEFRVGIRLRAAAGDQQLDGELRYQACDAASCFPPRTLPIHVAVVAR